MFTYFCGRKATVELQGTHRLSDVEPSSGPRLACGGRNVVHLPRPYNIAVRVVFVVVIKATVELQGTYTPPV